MSESAGPTKNTSDWMDGSALASRQNELQTSHKNRRPKSQRTSSMASAEISLEEPLYFDEFALLASLRAQRLQDLICNNNECSKETKERLETLSDLANTFKKEPKLNMAAWEVIDREITEWQRVSGSGRPSWWSPVKNRSRVHQAYISHTDDSLTLGETKRGIDLLDEPNNTSRRSRAQSESSVPDTTKLHDLAYLIAVQLLGACFTLPPENILEPAISPYHFYNPKDLKNLPDSRLISALRMHTHFRYTPGFGHHARNNSMAGIWANIHDGRCTPNMLSTMHFKPLGVNAPDPRQHKSKRRVRRRLNTTEASVVDQDVPRHTHDGSADLEDAAQVAAETAWNRRKGLRDDKGQEMVLPPIEQKRINISVPPSPNPESTFDLPLASVKSIYTHKHRSKDDVRSKSRSRKGSANPNGRRESKAQDAGSTSKSLESEIRTEPHPVFIQPVKEMVSKRWRTFRNRFGRNDVVPDANSTSNDFVVDSVKTNDNSPAHSQYVGNLRLTSPPGMLTPGSAASTPGGKDRRRKARKASEIHSGTSIETPTFNTPMTERSEDEVPTDALVAEMDIGRASPTIHLVNPLNNTPISETDSLFQTSSISTANSTTLPTPSPNPRSQSMSAFSPKLPPPAITRRNKRKSMLSEMHTPDTYESPAIEMNQISTRPPLSLAGSFMNSTTPTPGIDLGITPYGESPFDDETPGSIFVDWSAGNTRQQAVEKLMEDKLAMEIERLEEERDERQNFARALLEKEAAAVRERMAVLQREIEEGKGKEKEKEMSGDGTDDGLEMPIIPRPRPRVVRMSTSGTQCFMPKEDGVEIDGLPVGPGLDEAGWNVEMKGVGRGKGARESSFL